MRKVGKWGAPSSATPTLLLLEEPEPADSFAPKMFLARTSAALEASLSSHAFVYLLSISFATTWALMFVNGARDEFLRSDHNTMRWVSAIARGTGSTLNISTASVIFVCSRLFLTVLRETPLITVFPVDALFPTCHIVIGYVIFLSAFVHSAAHIIRMIVLKPWMWGFRKSNMAFGTGFSLLILLVLMVSFAHRRMRRKHFRTFHNVHISSAILFYVVLIFHGLHNGEFVTLKFLALPITLYSADRIMRWWKVSEHRLVATGVNTSQRGNVMRLRLPRPFSYKSGQYAGTLLFLFTLFSRT